MILTDMACRNAQSQIKNYKLSDGEGLYLEITPKGKKYWRLKYRFFGTEKRLAFGCYPEVSLLEARVQKLKARKLLRNDEDPAEVKREKKMQAKYNSEQTFKVVALEWYNRNLSEWGERHANDVLYRLEMDIFPEIGSTPFGKLTTPMLADCIFKIEARGAKELARRARQNISRVFNYATITGRAKRNIAFELQGALKKRNRGHYASLKVSELPDFVKVIYNNDARLFKQTKIALKLMLLLFQRTKELIEAPRSEFNLEKAEWNIAAHRMKMRKPHFVPLSKQAVLLIKELIEMNGKNEFLFPSIINYKKPMNKNTLLKALDTLGYAGEMTGHGFRALAMSSIKEKLKYQHHIVDRQLAHEPEDDNEKAYDRAEYIEDRTKMMQDWADYIDELVKV